MFYVNSGVLVCTDILARGIDMDDVDWVVQFDAPKMVNSFVHRCGRTARSNREGNALTFLLPNEEAFVNFLVLNQQVPLEPYQHAEVQETACNSFLKRAQDLSIKERSLCQIFLWFPSGIIQFNIFFCILIGKCTRRANRLLCHI